ncbi:hypothetical protein D9757_008336 [Collybiopsis confluens]|uniref:Uncharacterized protein n=1 Tax=Collybiopsis confluens TaxID=2823264 RepID=A0A8H5M5W3_9AGAR|nr:hypothetical protein D9757_008336 [Collybiopsis confluens]
MTIISELPWPDLGSLTRGATRGNQGQKGSLGPPDRDGGCILQLRVQAGALEVYLHRQASEWYRVLEVEVEQALSLSKTYWRKARRRHSYDKQADQAHMELHEWLQQLKDKTLAHLDLLVIKGVITGSPLALPDDYELPFLREFIDRHNAGIPHNPRLREGLPVKQTIDAGTSSKIENALRGQTEETSTDNPSSPSSSSIKGISKDDLLHQATKRNQELQSTRAALENARRNTESAFARYNVCRRAELRAQENVLAAEKRRDDCIEAILSKNRTDKLNPSMESTITLEEAQAAYALAHYRTETADQEGKLSVDSSLGQIDNPGPWGISSSTRRWGDDDTSQWRTNNETNSWGNIDNSTQTTYPMNPSISFEERNSGSKKRVWEEHSQHERQVAIGNNTLGVDFGLPEHERRHEYALGQEQQDQDQDRDADGEQDDELVDLPPRKRMHTMLPDYN